jgi:plasmid stabilization system protein ParE
MLQVVWLETALADLTAITEYIADRNPIAATKLNARLQDDADVLGELPAIFVVDRFRVLASLSATPTTS